MAMFGKEQDSSHKEAETIIGSSVKVEGNFTSSGDIIIDGHVNGIVKTSGNVKIGEKAKIKADVEATNVYSAGEIRGNIKSSEKLELKSTAKILGNVETNVLSVEEGAVLNGKCQMGKKEEQAKEIILEIEREEIKSKKNKK